MQTWNLDFWGGGDEVGRNRSSGCALRTHKLVDEHSIIKCTAFKYLGCRPSLE